MTLALGTGILGKDVYDRYVQQEREEQAKLIQYEQPNYFVSAPATMQALQYFETMYRNSSSAHTVELQALLESTVVREITNGNIRLSLVSDMEIDWGEGGIYGFLLKFSRENAKLLAQWGVSIGKPYQHMLQHLPDLKKTLALQESEDVGKIIPKSQPPDPQYLPSLTYVIIRYGSDSPEFEKALQERREAIKAYDAWQKQHQGLQPLAFL
jgi:hypothetical protein